MLYKIIFSTLLAAALIPCGQEPSRAEKKSGADAHAKEIMSQARAALGGEDALSNIRSLSASGSFIIGIGENRKSGQLSLDWLLPAAFMRSMKWSPMKEVQVTTTEVINGAKVWTASKTAQGSPMEGVNIGGIGMGRGGSRRGVGGPGGGSRDGGVAPELRDSVDSPEFQAEMAADLNCLLIALFLDDKDFPPEQFVYTGEMNIENVRTDTLQIKAADGITYTLAIDQSSHRPFMVGYQAPGVSPGSAPIHTKYGAIKDGTGDGQIAIPAAKPADIQIFFSDYQPVQEKRIGQVWLPHQINKASDGNPAEDYRIESLKLNPSLKPEQFEKKR